MTQAAKKNFDWFGVTGVEVQRGNLFFNVEKWNDEDDSGEREDRDLVQVFLDPEVRDKLIRELLAYDAQEYTETPVYIRDKMVVNMLARNKLRYVN